YCPAESIVRLVHLKTVHCQWGPFGEWSECDACTKTQVRITSMVVYAQFGGNPCDGERTQTRTCETTQGCPLEDGCGNRFRCRSGKCVSRSLVCNGDQDCEEDNEDELVCDPLTKYPPACPTAGLALPPKINLLGQGFDAVTEKRKGSVINTMSFGGQCRSIFSGLHMYSYRLPLSTTQYNFMVQVRNDFSDETFNSRWHYAKDIVRRETLKGTNRKLLILKNTIEVVQFQNNAPQYLPISEEFWKALVKLPTVYNYDEYRKVLERFGTHYLSEGSLGGSFLLTSLFPVHFCLSLFSYFLYPHCPLSVQSSEIELNVNNIVRKVNVDGGSTQHIAALLNMNLDDADKNQEMYSNWADSIRSFPDVIKQKLRPVSELVKEVQCAGVKRLYLRRAIDQYIAEHHPCHCQPCDNNGLAVMDGSECKCICKPGTSGLSCAVGSEVEGVIHGSWSCWSGWSSCSGGKRSRSRSCSNPSPQNGGQHCTGESTETSDCEDQELQYLKTMEPQCFDLSLPAKAKCGEPPVLINGYVLEPKDVYIVTSRTEYTCIEGYHLVGNSMLECTADQTWTGTLGLCTSGCRATPTLSHVSASPLKQSYGIGERITLSCPEGRHIVGETEIICDPSLHFSPDPAGITCSEATVQCKPWEKLVKGKCICRMPFECTSSLEVCATSAERSRAALLSVCKLHALQCIGKNYNLSEDSACQWPQRTTTLCNKCQMWETCDGTNIRQQIKLIELGREKAAHKTNFSLLTTMSECEAGQRRCKGEKVSVLSILPCTS
uniref:Complement component C7 n=1 Tax=Myripristis murdjan TaxID=586833 RepID=A0A667XF14_9TELE